MLNVPCCSAAMVGVLGNLGSRSRLPQVQNPEVREWRHSAGAAFKAINRPRWDDLIRLDQLMMIGHHSWINSANAARSWLHNTKVSDDTSIFVAIYFRWLLPHGAVTIWLITRTLNNIFSYFQRPSFNFK